MTRPIDKAPKAPDVFLYTDYLSYFKDLVGYFKAKNPKWSYAMWAGALSVKNRSSLLMMVSGKRKPSSLILQKICSQLNLSEAEFSHLKQMIDLQNTQMDSTLRLNLMKLSREKHLGDISANLWLVLAISEILSVRCKWLSPAELKSIFLFDTQIQEIEATLQLLISKQIILKSLSGHVSVRSDALTNWIQQETQKSDLVLMQEFGTKISSSALMNLTPLQRILRTSFVKMSASHYREIEQILSEAQKKISSLSDQSVQDCEVFQLQLQFVPITQLEKNTTNPC